MAKIGSMELIVILIVAMLAIGPERMPKAARMLRQLEEQGFGGLPVCMAKTQYSFSDDPKLLGAPEGFRITVRDLRVSAGAGFVVALTGDIMTMPGLPRVPAAEKMRNSGPWWAVSAMSKRSETRRLMRSPDLLRSKNEKLMRS